MLKSKLALLALYIILFNPVLADENASISINDVWISEAPPTVSVLAAYAHIHNAGLQPKTLVSVSSDAFKKIELHLSKVINDTAKMEK